MDPSDETAVRLLASIARDSQYRKDRGLSFWGGFFAHRVERYKHFPLPTFVSRLMAACASADPDAALLVHDLSDEDRLATERALRTRPSYLIALAFERIKRRQA